MTKTAIILAAGKAQRLQPLSARRPKGMFLLAGKPLIEHVLEALRLLGVSRAIIVVDASDSMIRSYLGDGSLLDMEIEYVLQKDAGGTATALRLVDPSTVPVGAYVVPANVFIEAETLRPMKKASGVTTLLALATGGHVQGIPTVRGDRMVSMTSESPAVGSTRVSTGIHWLNVEFLQYLSREGAGEAYLDMAIGGYAADHEVDVREADGVWEPLIDPWDIPRINERAMRDIGVHIGENADIDESAVLVPPVWVGDGSHIGENSVIGPHVAIRTNVRIGALCEVRDSVINNNVRIDTRAVLRGAILDDGVGIGPGFLAPNGVIVGSDASLGAGVIVEDRHVIDAESDVPSGTVLKGS